ncbi:Acid-sensing ion channel 4-B [Taenia solium]|eukprot:TsM_000071300 transcript=TsM_000071300 gene=TsM_000071300
MKECINHASSMKASVEFGILRHDVPPLPPSRSRKAPRELLLNNQECIPEGSGFQGHCHFAEVTKDVPRHPISTLAAVTALELREAAPTAPLSVTNPSSDLLAVNKSPLPPHMIALAPQMASFTVNTKSPTSEILQQHKQEACHRKWLIRVGVLLAVALVLICVVYQICAWTSRWQKRRVFLLVQRTSASSVGDDHRDGETESVLSGVNITICNANPFRGSAIFDLPSGSYLYDTLTGIRSGAMRIPDFAKELSKQSLSTLIAISHHLPDMLKSCTINGLSCGTEEFESVINSNRLCFRLALNSSARETRLILDPQEHEYLLPNEAIVGFYLSVDNGRDQVISSRTGLKQYERSIDILQPPSEGDELFVGSQFQTFIQVGFSDAVGWRAAERGDKKNVSYIYYFLPSAHSYRSLIRSVVQVAKPVFSSSLLQLQEPVTLRGTSRVAKARLVQQWAYLRHENSSTVVVIENLALRLGNLKKDFDGMLQSLAELRVAQHMTPAFEPSKWDFVETCLSPTGTALNTIVNFTEGFFDHLCRLLDSSEQDSFLIRSIHCDADLPQLQPPPSTSETGSTLQLFVVQMLFFRPHTTNQRIIQLLRRQVSLLSIVNQELQQHYTAGNMDGVEILECTRCERLGGGGSDVRAPMSCRRMDRKAKVNMTRHWELFKKFSQAMAACTQRLDALNKDLEATTMANLKHIRAFVRDVVNDAKEVGSATHG